MSRPTSGWYVASASAAVLLAAATAAALLPPPKTLKFYVSNWNNNTIGVYNPDGSYAYSLTPAGLNHPRGMVFLPNGDFLVASESNDLIFRFGADEAPLGSFTHAELDGPTGMAVSNDGLLYVSSFNNDRVVIFDLDGVFVSSFSGGQLNGTNCVAFDSQGFAYVSGAFTGTVIKYDPANNHQVVDVFSPVGVGLVSPMSIARTPDDVLYVSGGSSHNIVKFSTAGETLGWIDMPPGFGPQGIAFDDSGHFFTSSFFLDRILEFDDNDTLVGDPITAGGLDTPRSIAFAWGPTGQIPATSPATLAVLAAALAMTGGMLARRRAGR